MQRVIVPFVYSILLGTAWSFTFKKKFCDSFAPAFLSHIVLVILSGLVFKCFTPGIVIGIVLSFSLIVIRLVRERKDLFAKNRKSDLAGICNSGLLLFLIFLLFSIVFNNQKRFLSWDEFSHWGMFLKESLRLDALYCMSPVEFAHKDYVPAFTVFETIWCRLCGPFKEENAYTAIQVLMFSMILPVTSKFHDSFRKNLKERNRLKTVKSIVILLVAILLPLIIVLYFDNENGFQFFHSIYCDLPTGILLFYCAWILFRNDRFGAYQTAVLTVALIVLIMSKMTSAALVAMIIPLVLIRLIISFRNDEKRVPVVRRIIAIAIILLIPIGIWLWFNKFVDGYVLNSGANQSYDGMKISSVFEIFFKPGAASVEYLNTFRSIYINAIFTKSVLVHGSYAIVLLVVLAGFVAVAFLVKEKSFRKKTLVSGIWFFVSGTVYALMMYFLYLTAFSEFEALSLASYERYMNSFLIAAVLFLVAVSYESGIWEKHEVLFYSVGALTLGHLLIFHVSVFQQVIPGRLSKDNYNVGGYENEAITIRDVVTDEESAFVVFRGDDGNALWHVRYYCCPRRVDGGSIGPAVFEGDIWSEDLSCEAFSEKMAGYDYIYFYQLDEAFINKYSNLFDKPELVQSGTIYRVKEKWRDKYVLEK